MLIIRNVEQKEKPWKKQKPKEINLLRKISIDLKDQKSIKENNYTTKTKQKQTEKEKNNILLNICRGRSWFAWMWLTKNIKINIKDNQTTCRKTSHNISKSNNIRQYLIFNLLFCFFLSQKKKQLFFFTYF